MNEYRDKLEDIVCQGVAVDLYHADEVLSLGRFVGQNANEINNANFGAFFRSLQIILTRNLILHIAKIFEEPNKRYSIRSIPSAIRILRANGDHLAIEQRPGLISALNRLGASLDEMEKLSDRELTNYLASFFEGRYSATHPDGKANARALRALKTMRDKVVAHPEAVCLEDMPKTVYAEIDELVGLAHAFVSAVGCGYLSTVYAADDGSWLMSGAAKRSTTCLKRLLQASTADVLPKD